MTGDDIDKLGSIKEKLYKLGSQAGISAMIKMVKAHDPYAIEKVITGIFLK